MRFSFTPCAGLLLAAASATVAQAPAAAAEATLEYTVEQRDTLIWLGKNLLVDPSAWPEVARTNRLPNPNHIVPGQRLRIPARLLRSVDVPATLVAASGDVRVDGKAAAAGAAINPGQTITTAEASTAILQLGDGSRVKVMPGTETLLGQNRRYQLKANRAAAPVEESDGLFASTMRLVRGSVDMAASKVPRAKPLEVTTPTAVIGVRGTEYRVHHDSEGVGTSRTEVLEGKVQADITASSKPGAALNEGFGAVMPTGAKEPVVAALAEAPKLPVFTSRFERPMVRFTIQGETLPLRLQVAEDPLFERIVKDQRVAPGGDVRIAGLADGTWHLRARRVDANGLEGRDAKATFVLHARPEPPAGIAPAQRTKVPVGEIQMAWAENTEAGSYRLQVAKDAEFQKLVKEADGVVGAQTKVKVEETGTYHWRMASVRPNGDRGPWGDAKQFEVRPSPAGPEGGLTGDGKQMKLSWSARSEDRQQVELSRNADFTDVVARAELAQSEWAIDSPGVPGAYYFRYRSVEPDGYITPWSSTLKMEIPRDWSFLWYFVPFVLAL